MIFGLLCDKNDTSFLAASIDSKNQMDLAVKRLGKVLKKPGVIHDVNNMMRVARSLNQENEQVPFDQIFDPNSKLNRLKGKFKPGNGQTFLQAWNEESFGTKDFSSIQDFLINTNLSIYFPYSDDFVFESDGSFTLTYSLDNEYKSLGYLYSFGEADVYEAQLVEVNEGYVELNPTLILLKYYPEDYVTDAFIDVDENVMNQVSISTALIRKDMDHRLLPQSDIIRTYIPEVRLLHQTRGILGGANRISLYKMSGSYIVDANQIVQGVSNGVLNVGKRDFKISRKSVRDKKWCAFNATFDDDWDVHENTQAFLVVTKHYFVNYGVNVEMSAKVGVKKEGGRWVPDFDLTPVSAKAQFSLGKDYQKHSLIELSRREVFSKIVTPDIIHGHAVYNGNIWTVRRAGDLQFFFIHEWTQLN